MKTKKIGWIEDFDKKFWLGEEDDGEWIDHNDGELRDTIKSFIQDLLDSEGEKYIDALIWCSGSEDFQLGGKARVGWEKLCVPLITGKEDK